MNVTTKKMPANLPACAYRPETSGAPDAAPPLPESRFRVV